MVIMNTSVLLNIGCTGTTTWIQIMIQWILTNQYVMIHAAIQMESSTSPATSDPCQNFRYSSTVAGSRRSCPTLTRAYRLSIIEKYEYVVSVMVWKSKVSQQKQQRLSVWEKHPLNTAPVMELRFPAVPGYPNARPRRTRATCRTASLARTGAREEGHSWLMIDNGDYW